MGTLFIYTTWGEKSVIFFLNALKMSVKHTFMLQGKCLN